MENYEFPALNAKKTAAYKKRRFQGRTKLYKNPRSAVGRSTPKKNKFGDSTKLKWKNHAYQTTGGLTAIDMEVNKRGRLVSIKASKSATTRYNLKPSNKKSSRKHLEKGQKALFQYLEKKVENREPVKKNEVGLLEALSEKFAKGGASVAKAKALIKKKTPKSKAIATRKSTRKR